MLPLHMFLQWLAPQYAHQVLELVKRLFSDRNLCLQTTQLVSNGRRGAVSHAPGFAACPFARGEAWQA